MSEQEPVLAGDRPRCQRAECELPATVRLVGTAARGELVLARIPAVKPLPVLLMEPVDLCQGHGVQVLAQTLHTWEA